MSSASHAIEIIQSEFPKIMIDETAQRSEERAFFKLVEAFAKYTKERLHEGNEVEVEHCFQIAHELLKRGPAISKSAIENVFIYSVSHVMECPNEICKDLRSLFMDFFGEEYRTQVHNNMP